MSVPKNRRGESCVQFVDTAREIVVHTIQYAKKFPKSAMFLITKEIVDLSKEVYKNVVCANTVYPKTENDIEIRAKHLKLAMGCIDTMDGLLGIAKELFPIDISIFGWVHWGELMYKEGNLIKKVLLSDKKLLSK